MKDYGWLIRGAQSAVFYYVSCGPCHDASYRRKRKKEAVLTRQEKERLRAENPEALHQPSPFDINPFWQEEIDIGPGPPQRKAKRTGKARNTSSVTQRSRGQTVGTESSFGGSSVEQLGKKIDLSKLKELDPAHIKEKWHNRHQRRDEEHMSDEEYYEMSDQGESRGSARHSRRASHGGSSVAPAAWPTNSTERRKYRQSVPRAPPVNDLHPPIVVTPSPYASERKWMKEGPPSAAFMNGKVGTRASSTRSRSGSALSDRDKIRASPGMASSLQRHVGQKALDEKIKRGETPEMLPVSRCSSRPTPVHGSPRLGHEHVQTADYAELSTPENSFEMQRFEGKRKRRPRPLNLASSNAESSSSSEDENVITPTTTLNSSNGNVVKPEPVYNPSNITASRVRSCHGRLTTIVSSDASNVSRASSPGRTAHAVQNSENISPVHSARSSPSPPTSLSTSPVPLRRTANYAFEPLVPASTEHVVITGVSVRSSSSKQSRTKRQGSKAAIAPAPLVLVRDPSLNVLQELVSPSTLLNAPRRAPSSPASEARVKLPDDGMDADVEDEDGDDDDDGWLWTETGERKWRSLREARDVRNRWSMDF